jgi:small subunit ribosomal protein S1
MDHRDAFESTAEPVARPASPEAAPHEVPAAEGTMHASEPSDAQPEGAAADTRPSEPAATEAAATEPAEAQPVQEVEQREAAAEAVLAVPPTSEIESAQARTSEPEPAQPVAAESLPPEPVVSAPVSTEPVSSEPATSEPALSEPVSNEQVTAPVSTEPVSSEPPATQAAAPGSAATTPAAIEPGTSEPLSSEPSTVEAAAPATAATPPPASEPPGTEAVATVASTVAEPVGESTPAEPVAGESAPSEPAAPALVDPRRLRAQQSWERVVAAHASGEHMTGTVTAAVKGGLLVDVGGIRGFLPASQVRVPIGTALDTLVKTKVLLKVLDVDNGRRRIVVSQRRAVDEDRRSKRAELLRSLAVGQTREATVARLTDFGAFVDLGGIDGLIPMRELAFERIEKASDVVNVGEQVTVQVLRIEENGKKIALSRKNALPDPWRDHAAVLRNGTTTEGKVVAKEPQLIVEIAPGVTGAVRPDEVNPADYELGEAIEVTVRSVDRVRRRIALSTLQAATAAAAPQVQQMTSSGFAPLGVELSQRKR